MNNRVLSPDFHGLKSSEGDAAALRGRGACVLGVAHTQAHTCPRAHWELGQDRGPWMNCMLAHIDHLATDGDIWGKEGRLSML